MQQNVLLQLHDTQLSNRLLLLFEQVLTRQFRAHSVAVPRL
jgi:hypothetical protein